MLLTFFLLVTAGCSHQQENRWLLAEANRLVEHNPDSARLLLNQLDNTLLLNDSTSNALYTVLMAQTGYVLYDTVPSDSLIASAVCYCEKVGNKPLLCRAIYYRAMNLYVNGHHDMALALLKKGEVLVTDISDVLYKAKYHESLCMVNDKAQCNDLMLKYAKLFFVDAIQMNDSSFIARGLSHVSAAFSRLGNRDGTEQYIMEAMDYLDGMDSVGKAYILTNVACSLHKGGKRKLAKEYLVKSLQANPMPNTYAELGDIYAEDDSIHKAEECWNKAMQSDNVTVVINTLVSMTDYFRSFGKTEEALETLEKLYIVKDSVIRNTEQIKLAEIQYKYDQQLISNKLQRTLNWLLEGTLGAIVMILSILYAYHRMVRYYTIRLDRNLRLLDSTREQIFLLESEKEAQIEHEGRIARKFVKKIEGLERKAEKLHREALERIGWGKQVYEKIKSNHLLEYREDESCLIDYYTLFNYDTYCQWKKRYENLSLRLLTFLILQDMQKTDEEICQILNIERVSLRSIKMRIRKLERK